MVLVVKFHYNVTVKWVSNEAVWFKLKVASTFHVFRGFFFSLRMNGKITWFYCVGDKKHCSYTVHTLFTGSTTLFTHLKIILLQYFQFSVFSFSNNKFNPNGPYIFIRVQDYLYKKQLREVVCGNFLQTLIFFFFLIFRIWN